MTTLSILQELQARDIALALEDENLRISGRRDLLTPDLLERLKVAKPEILDWLAACDAAPLLPLTDMQKAYLYGREEGVPLGGVSSHVYHEFDGCWDIDRLRAALSDVIDRHDALRMVIMAEGAKVLPKGCSLARITVDNLTGDTGSRQAIALSETREAMSHQVLEAGFGVLVHLHVTLLAADRMRLHVSHDGLVIDGLSMLSMFADLGRAYAGDTLVPLECDFAGQLALLDKGTGNVAAARAYWQNAAPALPSAPDLPLAGDPDKITAPRSTRHLARLSAAQWDAFQNSAKDLGLSPSVALGAAFCEVLSLWTGGVDFSLNMTIANRVPVHPDAFAVVGNFTQPCPVPFLHDKPTAAERARAFGQALRTGVEHRHLSGVEVLRTLARPDGGGLLLPVTLNCAFGAPEVLDHRHAFDVFGPRVYAISQTPQVWLNGFAFETGAGLDIEFDAVEGLFPQGVVKGIVDAFGTLLRQLADQTTWDVATFNLLPQSVQQVRETRNDTATLLPPFLLQDEFIARAHQSPDALALICTDETVTYGALLERACGIANWLRDHDLAQEALVGVVMHKGWEQIAAALGILMAGGAYLPVDAGFPTDRIAAVLDRGDAALVLTTPSVAPALSAITDPKALLLVTDQLKGTVQSFLPDNRRAQSADTLAYVLFTSGSTGVPKGVMIPHSNAVNLVRDINDRFAVTAQDRLFGISAFNFDLSVYDIFGGLAAGAAIVLPEPDAALDPEAWARQAAAQDVTLWNSVPAIAQMLLESDTGLPPRLRVMMMSGDKIPSHLPHALVTAKPDLQVMSLGGPTETTVWNILNDVTDLPQDATLVPYGYPNANNRAYILDAMGRPCPDWVAGELHAAGAGVARGYWKDPERTAQTFFHHNGLNERLYATGDVARYRPDGLIEILGRSDFQVKINGFRVELSEVETHLTAHPMVQRVVVTALSGPQGSLLAAVVVAQDGRSVQADELRDYLAERLPAYMVPSVYAMRDSLPLTANGKVDRKALGDLHVDIAPTQTQSDPSAPEGEIECRIAQIWEGVVQRAVVDANMRLAELGGSSLSAVRIATQIGRETGVRLPIRNLDRHDTVRAQARHVIAGLASKTAAE